MPVSPPPSGKKPPTPAELEGLFGDLFGEFFGAKDGEPARGIGGRGADLRTTLELTPREALSGGKHVVSISRHVQCESCSGSGRDVAAPSCSTCGGKRTITEVMDGAKELVVSRTCAKCKGRGHDERYDCGACSDGRGLVPETSTLTVTVPPGLEDGTRLRIPGKGDEASGNAAQQSGDVYVELKIVGPSVIEGTAYRGPTPDSLHAEARGEANANALSSSANAEQPWFPRVVPLLLVFAVIGGLLFFLLSN